MESRSETGDAFMEQPSIIKVVNLNKVFGGLTALNNVSTTFYQGQLQSIIGPNGAGKTTFFNLLSGMFPPTSGKIFFKGEDITHLTPLDIFRRRIVRTFQISSVFSGLTVYQNVKIAAQGRYRTSGSPLGHLIRDRQQIEELCLFELERLQLLSQRNRKAGLLAYGDKRRLEIVMGLVCEPELLLLDEPTAGMSPRETEETAELLKELSKAITLILVDHDMKVVMNISERIVVLNRGSILTSGTPREVQNNIDVQACYLGSHRT
jgi:branched-chain amino acid transport system ATP-binding protein